MIGSNSSCRQFQRVALGAGNLGDRGIDFILGKRHCFSGQIQSIKPRCQFQNRVQTPFPNICDDVGDDAVDICLGISFQIQERVKRRGKARIAMI